MNIVDEDMAHHEKLRLMKGPENIKAGFYYAPYIPVTEAIMVNGEYTWHRNKWKNFFLKVKYFFKKPQYLKHLEKSRYEIKKVNPKFYGTLKINEETLDETK